MTVEVVLGQIVEADLEPATERCAIRLLRLAREGQVNLTWEGFLGLMGMRNVSAARRHLTRMVKAGLIHYSTNDYVYITFLAYMPTADGAPTRRGGREVDEATRRQERDEGAPTRRPERAAEPLAPSIARPRAAHGAPARRLASPVRLDRWDLDQEGGSTGQPDGEGRAPARAVGMEDPRVRLLVEVGVDPEGLDLVRVTIKELLAIVLDWEADAETGKVRVGALVWRIRQRIEKGEAWQIPEIEDEQHPYIERFAPGLAAALRRRRYIPDEYADIIRG